jgi:hypothetical protein
MDFATITNNANSIIKTGGGAGGDTGAYKSLEPVESQREIIVSHLKSEYSDKTIQAINGKMFTETAKTYKNMLTTNEGEVEKLNSHASELEVKINKREAQLKSSTSKTLVLQVLALTLVVVVGVYSVMGGSPYVHAAAFGCIVVGFGYALFLNGQAAESKVSITPGSIWSGITDSVRGGMIKVFGDPNVATVAKT